MKSPSSPNKECNPLLHFTWEGLPIKGENGKIIGKIARVEQAEDGSIVGFLQLDAGVQLQVVLQPSNDPLEQRRMPPNGLPRVDLTGMQAEQEQQFILAVNEAASTIQGCWESRIGDIVSRNDVDEHEIVDINQEGDQITVKCIKPDNHGVFKVGDVESNVPWRYSYVRSRR